MIKNYIFDFGNVLAIYDKQELTAAHISDPETVKKVAEVVFDRVYWNGLDDGTQDDADVKAGIRERLPEDLHQIADLVYDKWIVTMPPMPGMQALVDDIKKSGGKLYLLSNISRGFARTYTDSPWIAELLAKFDGLVFSGPIGLTKPNRDIFEHILGKYSLNAGECVFIDDHLHNIEAAREVGINSYLFDGDAEKLRKYLDI